MKLLLKIHHESPRIHDSEVLRWYRVRERIRQRSNPDVELLFAHIHERFPPESPIEVSRNKLLRLKHEWEKLTNTWLSSMNLRIY